MHIFLGKNVLPPKVDWAPTPMVQTTLLTRRRAYLPEKVDESLKIAFAVRCRCWHGSLSRHSGTHATHWCELIESVYDGHRGDNYYAIAAATATAAAAAAVGGECDDDHDAVRRPASCTRSFPANDY